MAVDILKLCEMFEDMEKVKLDRARLFRMLEKNEVGEWKTWGEVVSEVKKNMVREIERRLGV